MSDLLPFIVVGLVSGSVYGLAGVGLVLTYKTSGIFNFAYGALATVAAYTFYFLYVEHSWPLAAALFVSVPVLGVAMGMGFERFAERIGEAKLATQIGATVGIYLMVEALAVILFGPDTLQFPSYIFPNQAVEIAGVSVQASEIFVFSTSIIATAGLYLFLRRGRLGIAMRAVVDNVELINLMGNNPARIRRWAWVIGCFFATLSGLLLAPDLQLSPSTLTLFVASAFGAAAIGGFSSLPMTWLGGMVIGLASSIATNYVNSTTILGNVPAALPYIVLFIAVLVYPRHRLFVRRIVSARPGGGASQGWRAPPLVQIFGGLVLVAFLACVPEFAGFRIAGWTTGLTDVILLLSLGLLVRTSGYVSLCQVSFAAVGAVAFAKLNTGAGLPWLPALLLAGLVVVPIGAVMAIPALRLGGLFLALATLGFGLVLQNVFYQSGAMFGTNPLGLYLQRPSLSWLNVSSDTGFYYVVLCCTILIAVGTVWIVRSRLGRLLRGISDSPIALTASGADLNTTHVLVFCLSAYMAAISGALLGMNVGQINGLSFDPTTSLTYLALIIVSVGGEPWYALLSGAAVGIVPVYLTGANVTYYLQLIFGLFAVQVGMFGLLPLPQRIRAAIDKIGEWKIGHSRVQQVPFVLGQRFPSPPEISVNRPVVIELGVNDLRVNFGGLVAVQGLNISARAGIITGLIGPNGAGKTTTFNVISGFNRPTSGTVVIDGKHDITHLGPAARARLGLGRTFQHVELFDSMSVAGNVALGREASMAGANFYSQLVTRPSQRTEIRNRAEMAIELCEIGDLVGTRASDLSTGQRRLVELARALAGPVSFLLLDEPSSGLDQAESARFGEILNRVVAEREIGVLLVEHNMTLVMDICKYIYVMDFGQLIFEGTAVEVRDSPEVQSAYLGLPLIVGT